MPLRKSPLHYCLPTRIEQYDFSLPRLLLCVRSSFSWMQSRSGYLSDTRPRLLTFTSRTYLLHQILQHVAAFRHGLLCAYPVATLSRVRRWLDRVRPQSEWPRPKLASFHKARAAATAVRLSCGIRKECEDGLHWEGGVEKSCRG